MSEPPLNVLLVEDDLAHARLTAFLLTEGGLRCALRHVERLEDCLAALGEGGIDVVLLDLGLPGSDGLCTLEQIRPHLGDVPVVVLTGASDMELGVAAMSLGAQDFLVKGDPSPEAFARSVRHALERKRAESAERRHATMESAMKAMQNALGVVGHELRTPLAALRLTAEHLLDETESLSAEQLSMLRVMHDETIRMSETLNNLLEGARLESGSARWNWSVVDVRAACEHGAALVRHLINTDLVRLELDFDEGGLAMRGDADAIRRLAINLLTNAAKHTPEGRIEFAARRFVGNGAAWIEISVRDTGSGMPEEVVSRLGEAFTLNEGVVSDYARGTGLGLSICRAIVAVHGGAISVRSKPGEGSTFRVRLRADLPSPTELELKAPPIELEAAA